MLQDQARLGDAQKLTHCFTWEFGDRWWLAGWLKFATFPTLEECFADMGRIVTGQYYGRYLPPWQQFQHDHDLKSLFAGVLTVYATAQYGETAWEISQQTNVQAALKAARNQSKTTTDQRG